MDASTNWEVYRQYPELPESEVAGAGALEGMHRTPPEDQQAELAATLGQNALEPDEVGSEGGDGEPRPEVVHAERMLGATTLSSETGENQQPAVEGVHETEAAEQEGSRELIKVTRYTFAGEITKKPGDVRALENLFNNSGYEASSVPEVTQEYARDIERIQEATVAFAQELGVDLTERLRPGTSHVHIHPPENTAELKRIFNLSEGQRGVTRYGGHQAIIESSPTSTRRDLIHEGLHAVSYFSAEPAAEVRGDGGMHYDLGRPAAHFRFGYEDTQAGTHGALNEALAELGAMHIRRDYLGDESDLPADHKLVTLMLDNLIARTGEDAPDVYRALQRDALTGEREAVRALIPVIGEEGLERLAHLDERSMNDVVRAFASFGCAYTLPGRSVRAIHTVHSSDLLTWLPRPSR